jgi:hypothetical protein
LFFDRRGVGKRQVVFFIFELSRRCEPRAPLSPATADRRLRHEQFD